jgi:RNA polymerase sigma-70 factor (ECF subfamily)
LARTVDAEVEVEVAERSAHALEAGSPEDVRRSSGDRIRASRGGAERIPLSESTDRDLLAGLRTGSEPHFNELYDRYFQRIYSFVYSRMRNHADAEDVVQETFTVVFRSIESYRGTSSLLSWIYGIAKNTLNNSLRRVQAESRRLDALNPNTIHSPSAISNCTPEELLCLQRYAEIVGDRLGSVSSWQSEVFAMRHLENLTIPEISARTHRSSDAIRSCLYRMKRLFLEAVDPMDSRCSRPAPTPHCAPGDSAYE